MGYRWTQNYPSSKYERLYHAQKLLEVSRLIILLDRLEPIEDLSDAKEYLRKFQL